MDAMEKRREEIVRIVNEKGNISFSNLKKLFPDISEMTLRTDLKALDEDRRLVRVYGAVKSVDVVIGTDDLLGKRANRNIEEKQEIAEKAVRLIHPHTTIYLDSGSTATLLAKQFQDQPNLIFTSGLTCATELSKLEKAQVRIPGGQLNRFSMSVCGLSGMEELGCVNFDLAFIGVTCFDAHAGFTCGSQEEAALKKLVIGRAAKKVILMDSSKVDTCSTYTFCELNDIDVLVSDQGLPKELQKKCEALGIVVL